MTRYTSDSGTTYADIDDSTQYATLYSAAGDKPVGTLRRRHAFDAKESPRWEAFAAPDGDSIRRWHLPRDYQGLVNDAAKALARHREGNA